MSFYPPIVYRVTSAEHGWRLDTVLRSRLRCSRRLVTRLKRSEQGIMLNGVRAFTNHKVTVGDRIELRMEQEYSEDILPQPDIPLDILYEDEALLILNKPAGRIVHPTLGHYQHTLANGVVAYWQQKGEQYRFRAIHRLDEHTSGVIAVAKNPYIQAHISEQMQAGEVYKEYLALVQGVPVPAAGRIEAAIDRDHDQPHLRVVRADGDYAATTYEVTETFADQASMVKLRLETGRTHQIRVHMKYLGTPIIGDELYGVPHQDAYLLPGFSRLRQALHAAVLSFQHPLSGEPVCFRAPLPEDMVNWLQELQKL